MLMKKKRRLAKGGGCLTRPGNSGSPELPPRHVRMRTAKTKLVLCSQYGGGVAALRKVVRRKSCGTRISIQLILIDTSRWTSTNFSG